MLKLLIVDDEPEIRELLETFFRRKDYEVITAQNGKEAVEIVKAQRPHIVFLDVRMPVMDGLAALRQIRAIDQSVKVIMITAFEDESTVQQAKELGSVDYIRKPFNLEYLERTVIQKVSTTLFEDLRREINEKNDLIHKLAFEVERVNTLNKKLKTNFYQTILSLAMALEARDRYTHGHSERVDMYSKVIAEEMGQAGVVKVDDVFLENLHLESRLHDIGKIAVPDAVLNKAGRLTEEEFTMIKVHPVKSAHILAPLEDLKDNIEVIRHHHERFDGKGYPTGLSGESIPLRARIIAVADAFDAMTSDRPYRKAMAFGEAFAELQRNKNTQFDARAVDAFVSAHKKQKIPN